MLTNEGVLLYCLSLCVGGWEEGGGMAVWCNKEIFSVVDRV